MKTLIEAFMITILLYIAVKSSFSDIRHGIISNRMMAIGLVASAVVNILYYSVWGREMIISYLINLFIAMVAGILLYALRVWAGGDTKLFIVLVSLMPAAYYHSHEVIPSLFSLALTFVSGLLFIIAESVYFSFSGEKQTQQISKISVKTVLTVFSRCIAISSYTFIANFVLYYFFPHFYYSVIVGVDMLIVLAINNIKEFKLKWVSFFVSAVWIGYSILMMFGSMSKSISIFPFFASIIVLLIRQFAAQYNYKTIPSSQIKKGMILSYSSVYSFLPYSKKFKDLPLMTTEDIKSRLTDAEADSIVRLGKKYEKFKEITIVRKEPFAIFISLGILLYLLLGVR